MKTTLARPSISSARSARAAALTVAVAATLAVATGCGEGTTRPPPGAEGDDLCPDASYSATIQPLFDQRCRQCHRSGVESGGLDLETHDGVLAGGLSGAAVVPGDCEASLLYRSAAHLDQPFMPPGSPLDDVELSCLCSWIDAGVPDD